ncbi:hypothetical protein ACSNOI_33355 [Actinomadura kijaniata]
MNTVTSVDGTTIGYTRHGDGPRCSWSAAVSTTERRTPHSPRRWPRTVLN